MNSYRKIRLVIFTLVVCMQLVIAMPLSMEKDIEIMENILDKLIIEESPILFSFGDEFQGDYYNDYGLILTAESSGFFNVSEQMEFLVPESRTFLYLDENGKDLMLQHDDKERKEIIKKRKQELEEIKKENQEQVDKKLQAVRETLEDFFMNYTRGAMEMDDQETIMVTIKIDRNGRMEKKYEIPAYIQMSASVADLQRFFRGKMDEDKLKRKLVFNAPTSDYQKKDIEVMINIFDTFLEKESELWNKRNKSDGFYLKGFGAVFNIPIAGSLDFLPIQVNTRVIQKKMIDAQRELEKAQKKLEKFRVKVDKEEKEKDEEARVYKYNYRTDKDSHIVVSSDDEKEIEVDVQVESGLKGDVETDIITFSGSKFSEAELDSIMNKTQEDIIKTLSIYGATLKSVQPDEKISVNIKLNNISSNLERNILCRKQDVLDYTNGKISYPEFRKRFAVN